MADWKTKQFITKEIKDANFTAKSKISLNNQAITGSKVITIGTPSITFSNINYNMVSEQISFNYFIEVNCQEKLSGPQNIIISITEVYNGTSVISDASGEVLETDPNAKGSANDLLITATEDGTGLNIEFTPTISTHTVEASVYYMQASVTP